MRMNKISKNSYLSSLEELFQNKRKIFKKYLRLSSLYVPIFSFAKIRDMIFIRDFICAVEVNLASLSAREIAAI